MGTWDRLAEICGQYLGKGQMVAIDGRLQTRQWEDEKKASHWKPADAGHPASSRWTLAVSLGSWCWLL